MRKPENQLFSFTFSIVLSFIVFSSEAQNIQKLYEEGEKKFYKENFEDAQELIDQVVDLDENYKDATYKLEIAKLLLKENREYPLDKMLAYRETKGKSDKFYQYWMGRIYANRYMFPEAIRAWKSFLKKKSYKSKEIVSETKSFIEKAKGLVTYFDNPDNYEVHPLEAPINTESAEMTPVYSAEKDELLFASSNGSSNPDDFRIFHSVREGKSWSKPSPIPNLGTFTRENANIEVVDEDGKLFLFKDVKGGDLFYSQPSGDTWTVPVEFDSKITSTHLASHFFINEHEDRIIFASDQRKKYGLDLYESFRDAETGKWGKPKPFASNIDTEWDEDSPYLSPDEKRIYFSSNRAGGIGGYDIYMAELDEQTLTWGDPVNMGWPINSPDDDFHFKLNPDQTSGYFISNRIHSKGDFDIYFFWQIEKAVVKGKIFNRITNEQVTQGEIRFHPTQYLDEYFRSTIGPNGEYQTSIISDEVFKVEIIQGMDTLHTEYFEIHDAKGEAITHIKDFNIGPVTETNEQLLASNEKTVTPVEENTKPEIRPKASRVTERRTTTVEKVEDLGGKYRTGNKAILRNIYFDFGTSQLQPESSEILNRIVSLLKANPTMRVEIAGHTDNVGPAEANEWISQRRAEAVLKWLNKKGIPRSRMIAKGYGESQPLATNDDEKDGRELNRRIEILVIE